MRPDPAAPGAPSAWIRDDRYGPALTALLWVLVVLMIVPDGLDYASLSTGKLPSSGSAVSRLLWLALLGGGAGLLLLRARLALLVLRSLNPFLLAFAALAALSVAWSIEPGFTIRRLVRLATIMMVCGGFTLLAWHRGRFQQAVRPILTIMLFGSLVFGIVRPDLAIHSDTSAELVGAWRGLTNHKNTLGALAALGMLFWVHAALAREAPRLVWLAGIGIAGSCLVLSRSSTSLLSAMFSCVLLLMLLRSPRALRPYMPYLVGVFVVSLLLYSLAVLRLVPGLEILLKPVVMLTGKDLTFTGRSEIWALIGEHIRFSPMLGTGFGAYWIGPVPSSPSYEFVRKLYFYPASAHNGYLEVINDLGAVGLLCLLGYLFTHVAQALRLFDADRPQACLYLALFFEQTVCNLSETQWLSVTTFAFVVMTLASFALARDLLDLRLREYYGAPPLPAESDVPRAPPRPLLLWNRLR